MSTRMTRRSWSCLVAIGSLFLASVAGPAQAADAEAGASGGAWLYVVQGDVTEVFDTRLAITAGDRVLAFSERPMRAVRFVDLAGLVAEAWGEGGDFRQDPPNASLIDVDDGVVGVVEITDASHDNGLMVMTVVRLEGSLPAKGSRIALTIDSHAEGDGTTTSGDDSHAEGGGTAIGGSGSHAEGLD
jgi:hypothetical protein